MKHFKTISEFLQHARLPAPQHPLVSVYKLEPVRRVQSRESMTWAYDFYCVAIKRVSGSQNVKVKYGQKQYDYDSGIMSFVSPNQVLGVTVDNTVEIIEQSGWILLVHPDFLWNTPLAKTIKQYDFWGYSVNEALFLSEKEEEILISILRNIEHECQSNIDKFSKQIIIAQLESFFSYSERFYHRQFLTREKANHQILDRLETLLIDYFNSDDLVNKGLPTVQYIARQLHLSPKYLSDLLRVLTEKTAQQHIHDKLIEKAKEKLSITNLSISEIAYELGFKHLQSFSKLFKIKTNQSPLDFRQSFN
ncbi:MAG: helix-turn-helix transcriptional regulator [Flavipsychrobacter sp.]|nr:helix-turn-helix transcriptional regulator [Flavipsychrobacter sp.]